MGYYSDWSSTGIHLRSSTFTIYINDLPSILRHLDINIYADDSELHCSGNSVEEVESKSQKDLNRIELWLAANLLKVNVVKSACMLVGSKRKTNNKSFNVSLYGDLIPFVDSVKYLGVHIDRFLKWDIHINNLVNKVRSRLYMLCRLKPLSSNILLRLYRV